MNNEYPNYFGKCDKKYFDRFASWRTRVTRRLVPVLDFCGMTPDLISYIALSMIFCVVFIYLSHPLIASVLIGIGVLLDGIDGAYARNKNAQSERGAFIDIICDQLGLGVIGICSIYYGLLNPEWGTFYITIYIVMICLIVYQNMHEIDVQLHIRTKYVLFLLYFIYAFTKKNYMNLFIPAFAIIHFYTVMQSLFLIIRNRLRRNKSHTTPKRKAVRRSGFVFPENPVVLKIKTRGYIVFGIVFITELLLIVALQT